MVTSDMVMISREEYNELLSDQFLLNCLRNAGVDNTDVWEFALEEFNGDNDE